MNMSTDNSIFYDIGHDLAMYPEAAIFIIIGGRSTGKTYSTLKYVYEHNEKFVFIKRTNIDVKLMAPVKAGKNDKGGMSYDMSPFKSINNDIGSNVRAFRIMDGFAGFWECDSDNNPLGDPIGYILSFNSIQKVKGFDLSDCNYIIFDEFIPLPYERVNRNEGMELLDLYRTVGRANNIKYGKILKLICLANATTVSCPVLNELELTDVLVDMKSYGKHELYLAGRGIFIRQVEDINGFREKEQQNPIYKAMHGTKWERMSLDNDFAYNDFTNVKRMSLKNMRCYIKIVHKQKEWYIYIGDSGAYMTYRKSNTYIFFFDLNKENDQKKFYLDYIWDLRSRCVDGNMKFETYEMYDLIINYKDFYKVT